MGKTAGGGHFKQREQHMQRHWGICGEESEYLCVELRDFGKDCRLGEMEKLLGPILMSFDSIWCKIVVVTVLELGAEVEGLRCLSR